MGSFYLSITVIQNRLIVAGFTNSNEFKINLIPLLFDTGKCSTAMKSMSIINYFDSWTQSLERLLLHHMKRRAYCMQDQSKSGADFVRLDFCRSLESDLRSSPSGEGLGLLSRLVINRACDFVHRSF